MSVQESHVLFDFQKAEAAKDWQTINDDVMGGVSEGHFQITENGTLEFFGTLSLENNGGFASVRTTARNLGLQEGDALLVRLRGDGREYSMNVYVSTPLVAFSYRAAIETQRDEWLEIELPLEECVATRFGKLLPDAPPVDPKEINGLGFLLGDKKSGPFQVEVDWIRVVRRSLEG